MTQPNLTIVRGHQGSGKTTQALALQAKEPDLLHFENDHFLEGDEGYVYSPERHARAKVQCLETVERMLDAGNRVVVASTFTTLAELQPYLDLVPGEPVRVFEMFGDFENTHGVPQEVIEAKKLAFEPYPGAIQVHNGANAPKPGRSPGPR